MRRGFSLTELVLAFGIVAAAILSLVAVFIAGVQMSARSRDVTAATEVARQVLEAIKVRVRTNGQLSLPAGAYLFDGRVPQAAAAGYPPAPYPVATVNRQRFFVVVSGSDLGPTLKRIAVDIYWGPTSKISMETHLHP
jgi:uncharacterized protein (TIGR02598 family)